MSTDLPTLPGPGDTLGSGYRIVRRLGQGAMGVVYEVEREEDGTRWAAKTLLKPHSDKKLTQRFTREAQILGDITSPHVVPVEESSVDERTGYPFIVMDYLEGEDLEQLLKRTGPLPPDVAVRIALQAAEGLHTAHSRGIVHRDIKPSNLFLAKDGDHVLVKVFDFGIAKQDVVEGDSLTASGSAMGTPGYMAPEQLTDAKRVDERTDVWGLGATLFELLSGQPPVHGDTLVQVMKRVLHGEISHLQEVAPWIDAELAGLVHTTLIIDREKRCPSMHALSEALEPFTRDEARIRGSELAAVSDSLAKQARPKADLPQSWEELAETMELGEQQKPDPLLGVTLGGRYELKRVLGSGGMGAVYLAETPDGERFAVKVILDAASRNSRDALRRFLREARSAMQVESPYVVQVFEADTDPHERVPYMVMELLEGADLSTLIKREGPLKPDAMCRLFVQACEGLSAAHAQGIVHRDIKPGNLFLHQRDGDLVMKVCDFGVAKQLVPSAGDTAGTEITRTGGILGSPVYMSPEQAQSAKDVDVRSDIWSLCISLREAVSGMKPWTGHGSSMGQLLVAICTKQLEAVGEVAPWLDEGLEEAIQKGLQREREDRYASVDELKAALEPHAVPAETKLTLEELPLPPASRKSQRRVAKASAVTADSASDSLAADTRSVAHDAPKRSPMRPLIFGGLALAVAGGIAFTQLGSGKTDTVVSTTPAKASATAAETAAAEPSQVTARVPVEPESAQVRVAGEEREVDAGVLELKGEPGDSFQVELEYEGQKKKLEVTLRKDGTTAPTKLALDMASADAGNDETPAKAAPKAPAARPVTRPKPAPAAPKPAAPKPAPGPDPSPSPAPGPAPGFGPAKKWR